MNEVKKMIEKSVKQATRLFHEGNLAACQLLIEQTLKVEPHNDEALQIAGLLKLRTGNTLDAITLLQKARSNNAENPDHHNNLALAYSRVGKYDEAMQCAKTAISMAPGRQVFWTNYGVQLRNKACAKPIPENERNELLNECEKAFMKALEINSNSTSTMSNLASLYAERHDMKVAAEWFEKALTIDDSLSGIHVDLSYVYFLNGENKKAWKHYEHRMAHYPQANRWEKVFPSSKRWDGQTSLEDKIVLVFCEQGCGDSIHFARYLSLLKTKKTLICCHEPLKELLSQFGETYEMGQKSPQYDISIPIMSLPFLLNDPKTKNSYIEAPKPANLSKYDQTLKIGICWAGNPQHPGDRFRSIPLNFLSVLSSPKHTLFSLQKDYRPRKYHDGEEAIDLCSNGPKIIDLSYMMSNFEETAKYIMAMDLVVSVDTAILHLTGSLGKKGCALLPYSPDWRWGLKGEKTDLYPSLTLLRQPEKNDWNSVIKKLKDIVSLEKISLQE